MSGAIPPIPPAGPVALRVPPLKLPGASASAGSFPAQSALVASAGTVQSRTVAAAHRGVAAAAPRPSTPADITALKANIQTLRASIAEQRTALHLAPHHIAAVHSLNGQTLAQRAAAAVERSHARYPAGPKPSTPPVRAGASKPPSSPGTNS